MAICKQKHRDFGIGPINLGGIPNSEVVPNLSSSFVSIRNKPPLLGYLNTCHINNICSSKHASLKYRNISNTPEPFISRKPGLRPSSQPYLRNPQSHRSKGLFTPSAKNPTKNVHSPSSFDEFQKIPCFFFFGGGGSKYLFFHQSLAAKHRFAQIPIEGNRHRSLLYVLPHSCLGLHQGNMKCIDRCPTEIPDRSTDGDGMPSVGKTQGRIPKVSGGSLEVGDIEINEQFDVWCMCSMYS